MNSESLSPSDDRPLDPYYGGPLGAGIDWSDPNSKLAPYYASTGGVCAVTILALTFILFTAVPLWHTDFWTHLNYGEWISSHRVLPEREPLSPFTEKSEVMFDAMWLSQLTYSALFRMGQSLAGGDGRKRLEGGIEAIRLFHAVAAIGALAWCGVAYRRISLSVPLAIGGIVFLLALILNVLAVQRPQLLAFACFSALLCFCSRPILSRRAVVGIPLLMILWANLHGSFVVGFAAMGAILLGRAIEVYRERSGALRAIVEDIAVRRLAVAFALGLVGVGALNPYGFSLYADVIRFGGNPNLKAMAEWQPLDFSERRGGHWGYLAILVLLAATQLASIRPFSPTQLLLIFSFGVWPLFQQRAMSWWVPLVPWIVAPHWEAIAERWGWHLPASVPSFRKTALAAVLIVLAAFASPASNWLKQGRPRPMAAALHRGTPYDVAAALNGQPPIDFERYAELVRIVREQYRGRFVGRIFSSEIQGEYLLWSLPGDEPVAMFNHAQLFTPEYWSECMRVKLARPDWWEILDRHRADAVVVEVDLHPELCAELRKSSKWQIALDEGTSPPRDPFSRLFVAIRKRSSEEGPAP